MAVAEEGPEWEDCPKTMAACCRSRACMRDSGVERGGALGGGGGGSECRDDDGMGPVGVEVEAEDELAILNNLVLTPP